jgi:hypothetical protein
VLRFGERLLLVLYLLGEKTVGRSAEQWYLSQHGKRYGPLPPAVLFRLAGAGRIGADAWLLQDGTDVWVRATSVLGKLPGVKEAAPGQAPPLPRQSALSTATPARPSAAPAPSLLLTGVTCPSCTVRCRIPKPQGAAIHRCPHCSQQFRAALTSVGVVARCVDEAGRVTVRNEAPRTVTSR